MELRLSAHRHYDDETFVIDGEDDEQHQIVSTQAQDEIKEFTDKHGKDLKQLIIWYCFGQPWLK